MRKTSLIVIGGYGRLGRAIVVEALQDPNIDFKGAVVRKVDPNRSNLNIKFESSLSKLIKTGDVVIDASTADSITDHVEIARKTKAPYILAVTGMDAKTRKTVESASEVIPVVIAPNLSLG